MTQDINKKGTTEIPTTHKKGNKDTLKQVEYFFEKNQKAIIGIVVVIAIAVGGYFGYKNFVLLPKEEKASAALFPAERAFEVDSFKQVLNGDGVSSRGALDVIKKYSGTHAANLAHYYAGMSFLKTGDFPNAIKQLEKFDGKETPFKYLAYGALGDAYMETNNLSKGVEFYKKAAQNEKDNFTSPLFLFRAGLASEKNNKNDEAIKYYTEIKNKYPYSQQARDIDKYLARLGNIEM